MADLSDEDKRALLGPDYKAIEARAQKGEGSGKWKHVMIIAVFVGFASAVILADLGFAFHW